MRQRSTANLLTVICVEGAGIRGPRFAISLKRSTLKSSAIHKLTGRLPHLRATDGRSLMSASRPLLAQQRKRLKTVWPTETRANR